MKRVEQSFAPLSNAVRTLFLSEAKFVISKNKQTPGVNCRIKVNDLSETGAPELNAGRSFFVTFWLVDADEDAGKGGTMGMYCAFLDALGVKTDDQGNYLLEDGSVMKDPREVFNDGDIIPYLVGVPFVAKTTCKPNTYKKDDGTEVTNDQYNLSYTFKDRKTVLSVHPRKTDLYAPAQELPTTEMGTTSGGFGAI
jgi:hypothetical protein